MSRFDYVAYDDASKAEQQHAKHAAQDMEELINDIGDGHDSKDLKRAKRNAIAALEVCYMWIGKAIRDNQIERNVDTVLQEDRKDG